MKNRFNPPRWAPNSIPTDRGWEDPRTGELLVSIKKLKTKMGISEQEPKKTREVKSHMSAKPKKQKREIVDLDAMTKEELEVWARKNLDIELDRRKTKKSLIEQINESL